MSLYRICAAVVLSSSWCAAADMQSHYIRRDPRSRGVIVFVHGLMGDSKATWTNAKTNAYWPDLLTKDAAFAGFDVYVYEYPSPKLLSSYSPDEVAENMRLLFESDGVSKYHAIVFLTHSLGGVVTRAYLTKYRQTAQRVKLIYFFSTPTTGAEIARLGALISKNPQFDKLRPMTSESYLADLQRQWLAANFSFPSYCAYEKLPTMGQLVVEQQSASNLCSKHLDPIDANHIDIVKPESSRSASYMAFRSAFTESIKRPPSKPIGGHQQKELSQSEERSSGVPGTRTVGSRPQTQIGAPNGIAIDGGTVINPTVNNYVNSPENSPEEKVAYETGLAVAVASTKGLTGTGFWISPGHVATCSANVYPDWPNSKSNLSVGVLASFLAGKLLTIAGGAFFTHADISAQNGSGVVLLSVLLDPLTRNMQLLATAKNQNTGEVESDTEKFQVATLTEVLPQREEEVTVVGVEVPQVGVKTPMGPVPVASSMHGRVKRLGVDVSSDKGHIRIYIDRPFKASYCGAAVLNSSLKTVGVVVSGSNEEMVVASSRDIIKLMDEASIKAE